MVSEKNKLIISSILTLLLLGSVYSWSVVRVYVESTLNVNATLSGLPYMASLVFYSVSMLVSGKFINRYRPYLVIGGALLFILGFYLSSLTQNIFQLTFVYGVFLGTGVGMIYGVPLYIINQTFTSRVGFYSGLVLLGFGFSNVVMTPILRFLLDTYGVSLTFLYIAIAGVVVLALTLPALVKPYPIPFLKMIKKTYDKKTFTLLYIVFLLSLVSGLMIIGLSYRIGVINYQFDPTFVSISVSLFAVGNAFARPLFGYLVDRLGLSKTGFIALFILLFAGVVSLLNNGSSPFLFTFSYALLWISLGSWISIAPIAIKVIFGKDMYAQLYGGLFTAYGIAAVIGTLVSGYILDTFETPVLIYVFIIVISVGNIILFERLRRRLPTLR
jgi:MFS transporter, OFA family, oxalate/formate antiporter